MKRSRPCAVCHRQIPHVRATLLPETRLCIDHAREIEKHGGEFIRYVQQTKLSKTNSLKKNYGDVTVYRRRNYLALQVLIEEYESLKATCRA